MAGHDDLMRLAPLAGIEPFYWDIAGNYHQTGPETALALLAAMEIGATSAAKIKASIEMLDTAPWRRTLPPVAVVSKGEQATIPLHLATEKIGVSVGWRITEEDGTTHAGIFDPALAPLEETRVVDHREMQRRSFAVPPGLRCGYHELSLAGETTTMSLIITPQQCYLPYEPVEGRRFWGIAAQLYTLRSPGNWGIGDFTDLRDLVSLSANLRAAAVGINPLHALFPLNPGVASPYSPSSRLFLNALYLDVEAIPDFSSSTQAQNLLEDHEFAEALRSVREAPLVDYDIVARLKFDVLECLYLSFRRNHLDQIDDTRAMDFRRFQTVGGGRLRGFALYEALSESFRTPNWTEWPSAFHDPSGPAVRAFTERYSEHVEFFEYIQWQADRQLGLAHEHATASGMPIGLYRDLAVGVDPGGADTWAEQELFTLKARIGAPPDPFNAAGQEWGIPPMRPGFLREKAYKPFIDLLRANMRHAGALRIDHVMGLKHLFWVPSGETSAAGAYVEYPFHDLLGILALESRRNKCLVVGEDLGTVPEGFRDTMAAADILSYRVLMFEKDGDRFKRPEEYPTRSVACVSTHDLPTLKGYWSGADVALRDELGQYPSEEARTADTVNRDREKSHLLEALAREGLLTSVADQRGSPATTMTASMAEAVHRYVARTPAFLMLAQLDDLAGESEQVNLPGTSFERPNWRRKLSRTLDELAHDSNVAGLTDAITQERRSAAVRGNADDP